MLGTDIEFGIKHPITGNQMDAGALGIDAGAKIGLDGHSHILELRPDPAKTPKLLMKNLRDLLAEFIEDTGLILIAGPFSSNIHKDPIGLHIHVSYNHMKRRKGMGKILEASKRYMKIAHSHEKFDASIDLATALRLSLVYIGFILHNVEGTEGWLRRRSVTHMNYGPYGKLCDFRKKSHGCEYRAPSCLAESMSTFLSLFDIAKAINKWIPSNIKRTANKALEWLRLAKKLDNAPSWHPIDLPRLPEGIADHVKKPKLLDMANAGDQLNFHVDVHKKWNIKKRKLNSNELTIYLKGSLGRIGERETKIYGTKRSFVFKNGKFIRSNIHKNPNIKEQYNELDDM